MKNFRLWVILAFVLCIIPSLANAAARFAICATTCTWDNASTAMWSTTSGGATGASAPVAADTVTLDANTCVGGTTCTITVNADITVNSITMGACTASTSGCILDFSANNNNPTIQNFSSSGTGTRTLNMGNGLWTMNGIGTIWDYGTITNLTHNRNSSTITATGVSNQRTFVANGRSFGVLTLVADTNGNGFTFGTGGGTYAGLVVTGPLKISFQQSATHTFETAFALAGSNSALLILESVSSGTPSTVSVPSGTATIEWASARKLTFTGGATFTGSNSFDMGGNTGITITNPSAGGGGGRIIGG